MLGTIFVLVKNKFPWQPKTVTQSSTVVLEKVNKVFKLVTVEAQLSEILEHEEFYGVNYWPFQKKALIRVQGKVLAGYDLESINMIIDEKSQTITIQKWPTPQILSIDHEMAYYDVSNGIFNQFSIDDYNDLQKVAKKKIEEAAKESGILETAEEQFNDVKTMMKEIVESSGWKMIFPESTPNEIHAPLN